MVVLAGTVVVTVAALSVALGSLFTTVATLLLGTAFFMALDASCFVTPTAVVPSAGAVVCAKAATLPAIKTVASKILGVFKLIMMSGFL